MTSSYSKMRLIPDYLYEKLNQDKVPRSVDYGDKFNPLLSTINRDVAQILLDESKPIEERIRLFNAQTIKRLLNKTPSLTEKTGVEHANNSTDNFIDDVPHAFNDIKSNMPETPATNTYPTKKQLTTSDIAAKQAVKDTIFSPKYSLHPITESKNIAVTQDGVPDIKKQNDETTEKSISTKEDPDDTVKREQFTAGFPLVSEIFPSISSKHTTAHAVKPSEVQSVDLSEKFRETKDRTEKRSLLKKIFQVYFDIHSNDRMIFRDDAITPLHGASSSKIINFLIPSRNIHPKIKPAGFAAIAEVLREEKLLNPELFPNENLKAVFQHYMKKKTSFSVKIKAASDINKQINDIKSNIVCG